MDLLKPEPVKPEPVKPEPEPVTYLLKIPKAPQGAVKQLIIIPGREPIPVPIAQKDLAVELTKPETITVKGMDQNNYCILEQSVSYERS